MKTVPCLDASLSKVQVFATLQQSGQDLSIKVTIQPGLSLNHMVWAELIYGNTKLLNQNQKDALWKFDMRYQDHSCILKRALFHLSETTGDLNYFINPLKYFAQVLIENGIDDMEMKKGIQPFRTASGLINFLSSAEDLFLCDILTRQEYATLVNDVFEEQPLIEALYNVFQNPRILDMKNAENHIHLDDLLRMATNYYYVQEDWSMLKTNTSKVVCDDELINFLGGKYLHDQTGVLFEQVYHEDQEEVTSSAISSKANLFEHNQHGLDDCNINDVPYKKIWIVGNDQTDVLFAQVYRHVEVIDFLGGKYLLPRFHPKPCCVELEGEMKASWGADELGGVGDEVQEGYDFEDTCPSLQDVFVKLSAMYTLFGAIQEKECGIGVAAANALMSLSGFPSISNVLTRLGDFFLKSLVGLLCVASWIPALLSDANVGTLLLNSEYFKDDTSSAKDVDKSDKGTTIKKEHPQTSTVNLKVTSTKFNRNPFSATIQFLMLSGLIICQAGKDTIRNEEPRIRNDEQTMQTTDDSDTKHIRHGFTHGSVNNQDFANAFKDVAKSKSNLRTHTLKNDLKDALSELDDGLMFGLSDEIDKTLSEIRRYSPDDIEGAPKALRASSLALSQIKDYISNSDAIASMPSSFQTLFNTVLQELNTAETQVEIVEGLISKYYIPDESKSKSDATTAVSRQRVLSGPNSSSKKTKYDLGISRADYHLRARNRAMQPCHNIDNVFGHQQGYHGARHSRSNGGRHRRLVDDNTTCASIDEGKHKEEQCLRLAACARNYNLYDMFVFFFGDDINFDTGIVSEDEKITAYDEIKLVDKLTNITSLSGEILNNITGNISNFIGPGDKCDQLLQQFHRFDEGLSLAGKWAGGSVTGVCRGWGTSKVRTLMDEMIYPGLQWSSETHFDLAAT
ncbi:hypothetical protein ACHAW5_006449 [Stephanodiscus triporus]|uniref:Uncharacterized protein n=1 Tax=Stephanodiscus triporus TaxID=2934178 RepID=A0ABD3NC00_9STRA